MYHPKTHLLFNSFSFHKAKISTVTNFMVFGAENLLVKAVPFARYEQKWN